MEPTIGVDIAKRSTVSKYHLILIRPVGAHRRAPTNSALATAYRAYVCAPLRKRRVRGYHPILGPLEAKQWSAEGLNIGAQVTTIGA